jgi:hypothetical protein
MFEDVQKAAGYAGDIEYSRDFIKDRIAEVTTRRYGTRGFGAKARARLGPELSTYGASEPAEAFAEAFADFHINGSNAADVSKEIVQPVLDAIAPERVDRYREGAEGIGQSLGVKTPARQ